eukprot:424909_1
MANKGVEKRRNKKTQINNHMNRMRDYKFDIPTIDSMELSTLIHTIPSNDNDSRHINTNNSKHQNNIEQIYQINASKLSKRARVIHRNTINIFNTNHNVIETKTIDKLLNFMNIANAPYCIQSLLQYFGSKNGISKELLENMLIKLVKSNCLQSKQFENGSTLYWITQNDIKYNKQITVTPLTISTIDYIHHQLTISTIS